MFAYLIKYSIIFDTQLIYLISFHWIKQKRDRWEKYLLIFIGLRLSALCIMQIYVWINEFMSVVFCFIPFRVQLKANEQKKSWKFQQFWIHKASETFVYFFNSPIVVESFSCR